jgi:hypothetical protein
MLSATPAAAGEKLRRPAPAPRPKKKGDEYIFRRGKGKKGMGTFSDHRKCIHPFFSAIRKNVAENA